MKKDLAEWSVAGDTVSSDSFASSPELKQATVRQPAMSRSAKTLDSAISFGSIVKGIVTFDGSVRIDGTLEGDLTCSADLSVGEAGKVKANVRADVVKVFGTVLGDISAETLIELFSGARVIGNLKAQRIAIHDGVNFDGQCKMLERQSSNIVQLDNIAENTALAKV